MNLQILSAGLGTRLKPITDKTPKPALTLLNIPMIFWSYHFFNNRNLNSVVVNTFHLEQTLQKILSSYKHNFTYISDGKEVLGTGGGIANAKDKIIGKENFWVINGDSIFLTEDSFINETESTHKRKDAIATLVVMDHPEVGEKFGGIWVDSEDQVLNMGKDRPKAAVKGYHFTGFRVLSDKIFQYLKNTPSELFDALRVALKDGHTIAIHKVKGEFFETGNVEDYLKTTSTLLNYLKHGKYQNYLSSLLKQYSPLSKLNDLETMLKANVDIHTILYTDTPVKIFEDSTFNGFVVLGKNCEIQEGCVLENAVILENSILEPNTEVINSIYF